MKFLGRACFRDASFLTQEEMVQHLMPLSEKTDGFFSAFLSSLRGSFALVLEQDEQLFAAVDSVRSIPLFYRLNGAMPPQILTGEEVSDLSGVSLNDSSIHEFLASGYVMNGETLMEGVHQLEAGQFLLHRNGRTEVRDYYRYYPESVSVADESELIGMFDGVLNDTFARLIDRLDGRMAVLPLSGGLDSRLIAVRLKEAGYKNVVCYAYGKPGCADALKSKAVAEQLGFEWFFVPYSLNEWREASQSEEWSAYQQFAGGASVVPHPDEWLALKKIHEQGLVSSEAVFIPGHTGDFICGGHLSSLMSAEGEGLARVVNAILSKHYGLQKQFLRCRKFCAEQEANIRETLKDLPAETEQEQAAAYEFWEWRGRQSKLIVNAVRGYEFFGYDWQIPLWDRGVMDFWRSVPLRFKPGKRLYRAFLRDTDRLNMFADASKWLERHPVDVAGKVTLRTRAASMVSSLKRSVRAMRASVCDYYDHPLGVYGLFSYMETVFRNPHRRNYYSLLVKDYVRRIREKQRQRRE